MDKKRIKRIRKYVIERDGLICCYCEEELTEKTVTLDHIQPESKRGTFNTTNLTVACSPCNNDRGDQPFFEYIKQFHFSQEKIDKYERMYYNNLKIKILNIAKEEFMLNEEEIPANLIQKACDVLRINVISFLELENELQFEFNEPTNHKKIKYNFECIIKILESKS